jgi:membrane associated rhomboid family serine protease
LKGEARSTSFGGMLDDRSYMREDSYSQRRSATVVLIVVLTFIFALQCINDVYAKTHAEQWLAMTREGLMSWHLWQLITFQFLHVNLWHLFGNVLSLWFIGRFVEGALGTSRFVRAYFICGCAGGILQGVLIILFPSHFAHIVYGASAGTSGVFAIFAMIAGDTDIRLNFILPVKARVLLWITAGISLFFTLVPTPREAGVAHAAHLGGIIAGMLYLRFDARIFAAKWSPFNSRQRKRQLVQAASKAVRWRPRPTVEAGEVPSDEFISKEVDPILDKISAHGIHSLTPREREILEAARAKMAKR